MANSNNQRNRVPSDVRTTLVMRMSETAAEVLLASGTITKERVFLKGEYCGGAKIKNKTLVLSHFVEIGFKGSEFEDCIFSHSYFERCYFRKASLTEVTLTGCTFRDCNFDGAQFINCNLDYAEFDNCSVTFRQIQSCLPSQVNVLRDLTRNLRVNAQNRGQSEDYRNLLLEEMKASRAYNLKKALGRESYYKTKYPSFTDRLAGLWDLTRLVIEDIIWGYGELPTRVIYTSAAIVLLFASLYWALSIWDSLLGRVEIRNMPQGASIEYLWFSVTAFVSGAYGDLTPTSLSALFLSTVERGLGLTMFGFFVTALYRRISKR